MIYKCQHDPNYEINYVDVGINDTERIDDFFITDLIAVIQSAKLNIYKICYITDIVAPIFRLIETEETKYQKIKTLKHEYVAMLEEFITELDLDDLDTTILAFRVGYLDDTHTDDIRRDSKALFVEKCIAAQQAGFIDISILSGLEYSKTFVYKNTASEKLLELAARYDVMSFIGDDFKLDDIISAVIHEG